MQTPRFWSLFFHNRLSLLGCGLFGIMVLTAVGASFLIPFDPNQINLDERLQGPGGEHLLGTDVLGRDVFSRIVMGARISLGVAVTAVSISVVIGTVLGGIAGYRGGWIDEIIMRIIDIFLAFPGMLLAIAIMAILGPSIVNVVIALSLVGWKSFARIARASALVEREKEYVLAAKALGFTDLRIMLRHILPNIMMPVIVAATLGMAGMIMQEAGLSFLGLGAQPPIPSWGSMLMEGRDHIMTAAHLTTFPGLAIMISVLTFNFIGDGLRDALDPRFQYE